MYALFTMYYYQKKPKWVSFRGIYTICVSSIYFSNQALYVKVSGRTK